MLEQKWNKNWKFWEDKDSFALVWNIPEIARDITLPHDAMIEKPANPDSLNGGNTGFRDGDVYTYVKMLHAPDEYREKNVNQRERKKRTVKAETVAKTVPTAKEIKTKREALNYENEFKNSVAIEPDMQMDKFVDIYFSDKKNELKANSIRNKQHMINKHIIPYFGSKKLNEITPADIIQWQKIIQENKFSKTYERMIQNQINALFNHAQRIKKIPVRK